MKILDQLTVLFVLLLFLFAPAAVAFGPAGQTGVTATPELGRDLAVELRIPLFDPDFSDTPVASLGSKTVFLKELTSSLSESNKILFWEYKTEADELTKQFNQALAERIKKFTEKSVKLTTFTRGEIDDQHNLKLDAPLFSNLFINVPVASIDGVPITISEFARDLQTVHMEAKGEHAHSGAKDNIQRLIDRLITVRLVEREARNIGFDQAVSFRKKVENHAQKTLLYGLLNTHIAGVAVDEVAVDKLYRQISLEGQLSSYRFETEEDANKLLKSYSDGEDFDQLIAAAVKRGKVIAGKDEGYVKFKELLPNIAKSASNMEIGDVSEVFRQADGFILFKLMGRRFVEDAQARQFAMNNVWEAQRASAGTDYINKVIDQYTVFDEEVRSSLDFAAILQANPEIQLTEALQPLLNDERSFATVSGAETKQITVSEVAKKIKETFFHGTDVALKPSEVDKAKDEILQDMLFRMAGTVDARAKGLDQRDDYRSEINEFERRSLFDVFMQKVIMPEVRLDEEQVRAYYDEHQDEYMTPAMVKFKSLPFYRQDDAQDAADKLSKGSDFKWVSANAEGLVDVQDKDLLQFDRNILSQTALPEGLQERAATAKRGDTVVHAEPNNFFYVLYFENVFPPEAKPYDQLREEILKIVYQEEVSATIDTWVEKLKEAYETKVFLVRGER